MIHPTWINRTFSTLRKMTWGAQKPKRPRTLCPLQFLVLQGGFLGPDRLTNDSSHGTASAFASDAMVSKNFKNEACERLLASALLKDFGIGQTNRTLNGLWLESLYLLWSTSIHSLRLQSNQNHPKSSNQAQNQMKFHKFFTVFRGFSTIFVIFSGFPLCCSEMVPPHLAGRVSVQVAELRQELLGVEPTALLVGPGSGGFERPG